MHRFVMSVARFMALLGGVTLGAMILIIGVSILGRALNDFLHSAVAETLLGDAARGLIDMGIGAIRGDFELVEALMAFTIFAFMPLTQMTGGHAAVDVFTSWMRGRGDRILKAFIEVLFAVVFVIIAWQLKEGMDSRIRSGQTTLLLQFPVWWPYAASLFGAIITALVAIYHAGVRVVELITGQSIAQDDELGAEH